MNDQASYQELVGSYSITNDIIYQRDLSEYLQGKL